jgi:hypothetical protein
LDQSGMDGEGDGLHRNRSGGTGDGEIKWMKKGSLL